MRIEYCLLWLQIIHDRYHFTPGKQEQNKILQQRAKSERFRLGGYPLLTEIPAPVLVQVLVQVLVRVLARAQALAQVLLVLELRRALVP